MLVGVTLEVPFSAGNIRHACWILCSTVGIVVAAKDKDSFSYDIKPSPPTDKAVSFHAVCLVDVNADKASNFADGNLGHSDPAVII